MRSGPRRSTATPTSFARACDAVTPADVATIVYTSGTTGPPKGAVLTHANVMATLRSVTEIVALSPDDRFLSFLPLSHITERSVSHFGLIASGGETWFARSISTVAEDLPDCRPTIFFAVPRVWEKIREGVEARVAGMSGVRGRAARTYLSLAFARARELETKQYMPFHTKVMWLALDATVGAQLRAHLGLDRARITVSGAAPIHPDLIRWFNGIGVQLAEGYGQTEVALATTLNPPGAARVGTVGPPLPGVSVRLADDGEILIKGDNVCRGYWHDEQATRLLIDEDGWLRSGDLGAFDDRGYLRITGRKKDLIITAHGKNISPQNIETDLAADPLIAQAVVIGDGRRYLTALLALDETTTESWARAHNKGAVGLESLAQDPDLHVELEAGCRSHERSPCPRRTRAQLARLAPTVDGCGRRADTDAQGQTSVRQRAIRRADRRHVRRTGTPTIVVVRSHKGGAHDGAHRYRSSGAGRDGSPHERTTQHVHGRHGTSVPGRGVDDDESLLDRDGARLADRQQQAVLRSPRPHRGGVGALRELALHTMTES